MDDQAGSALPDNLLQGVMNDRSVSSAAPLLAVEFTHDAAPALHPGIDDPCPTSGL
jgi:hypothetical protein